MDEIKLVTLHGKDVQNYIDRLAELRIKVFREFPYLYDGYLSYERDYLQRYVNTPKGIVILALKGQELVGASTGLPMEVETAEFKEPFINSGVDLSKIFYFGESIILKEARGQKIGHQFFSLRELYAQQILPELEMTCFCAVERSDSHPLRPQSYKPLYNFWNRLGYQKNENLKCEVPWKDRDKSFEDKKTLTFWTRSWSE